MVFRINSYQIGCQVYLVNMFLALLNIWSLGHFIQWTFVGRFLFRNWWIFFALSIGWEILEPYLPYEFVKETWDNKISDLVVNTIGFIIGIRLRYDTQRM